jgi:hypothetical protein
VRRQQHRGVERRWVIFALAGIGALLAFFFAAWKFGGKSDEQIPNLGATTQKSKILPAASPTRSTPKKPTTFTLYVRAQHGNSWMDVRNWSQSGKALFTGTVELGGQDHRWVSRRLWITFGAPANLGIVWNGHLMNIHRSGAFVFTPHGFTRTA